MSNAGKETDLGTKYTCISCEIKFYDLNRPEPVCPKCNANQNDEPVVEEEEVEEVEVVATPEPIVDPDASAKGDTDGDEIFEMDEAVPLPEPEEGSEASVDPADLDFSEDDDESSDAESKKGDGKDDKAKKKASK